MASPVTSSGNVQQAALVKEFELDDGQAKALDTILSRGVTAADVEGARQAEEGLRQSMHLGPTTKLSRHDSAQLAQVYAFRQAVQGALETKQLHEAFVNGDSKAVSQLIGSGIADGSLRVALNTFSKDELNTLTKSLSPHDLSQVGWYVAYDDGSAPTLSPETRSRLYGSLLPGDQQNAFNKRFPLPHPQ